MRGLAESRGTKAAAFIHPLRVALTGQAVSPGIFEVTSILGRETVIARIDAHYAKLQAAWTAAGVVFYVLTLIVVKRSRDLDRYRYLLLLAGAGLLLLPLVPHIGEDINGARLWVHVWPI